MNTTTTSFFENLFLTLPVLHNHHDPKSLPYSLLRQIARREVENFFSSSAEIERDFEPFGKLIFPYHNMGAIDSLNLFDLDELILFSFYWANRKRYKYVLDGGANIGLHSILLSRCGFEVRSYEPDPYHLEILERNLKLNNCSNVQVTNAALSNTLGTMEFVRVLGNTTGSHLAGSKPNPYGQLERFPVKVEAIEPLIGWADLMKLDVEGQEKEILLSTNRDHWLNTDALVEVQSEENAILIFNHVAKLKINLFSQKINWQLVREFKDMPTSYRDGTLFLTCKNEMPWGENA